MLKNLSWTASLRIVMRLLAFVKIAILARLLTPDQFGLVGIAFLVLAFLEIFTETGINVFFIQKEGELKDYINTAWIVSMARGILMWLLIILFSSPIAKFFNSPNVIPLIFLIGFVPLLRGFINPAVVSFQKDLQFDKEFKLRSVVFLIDSLAAIAIAVATNSPESLIWGMLIGVVVEVLLSFVIFPIRPRFSFDSNKAKAIVGRGKWVTAQGVFNYLFHQGDDIVVGKLLGIFPLGIYQNAYKISTLPIVEAGEIFNKVAFPMYVKQSHDLGKLRKTFTSFTLAICALALSFGALLFFFPEVVIRILLGDAWVSAAPILRILAIYGVIRAVTETTSGLFFALKKQEYVSAITFVSVLGLAATVVPFVRWFGLVGAAWSAVVGTILSIPILIYYVRKIL